jgi:hypothetical protein
MADTQGLQDTPGSMKYVHSEEHLREKINTAYPRHTETVYDILVHLTVGIVSIGGAHRQARIGKMRKVINDKQ